MNRAMRTINYQVAFSMARIWAIAMGLMVMLLFSILVPELRRMEQQQMRQQLARAVGLIQTDLESLRAFVRDWGAWDDAYHFMAEHDSRFVRSNLLTDMPMQDFRLNVMSFLDLSGHERWSRVRMPDVDPELLLDYPPFFERLKQELLPQVGRDGLQGLKSTSWGPALFAIFPITDSQRSQPNNGYLLVTRWLDDSYLQTLSERVAAPLQLRELIHAGETRHFMRLHEGSLYRVGYRGLGIMWGEVLLLDSQGKPGLVLRLESTRDLILGSAQVLLWTLLGTLLICLLCGLLAFRRLQAIVLQPLDALIHGVQQYAYDAEVQHLPSIDSSREMSILTRRFREMALRLSQRQQASQAYGQRMEQAAYLDPLTHCFNRRYLDAWLEQIDYRTSHHVLMILDIDHFKLVNDTHGHDMGDQILCQFADVLRRQLRHGERLVRLGGEEFLVIGECDSSAQAKAMVGRLRREIGQSDFGSPELPLGMTASIGFCLYPLGAEKHQAGWKLCLKLADIALYRAKLNGRNTWVGVTCDVDGPLPLLQAEELIRREVVHLLQPEDK